MLEEEKKEAIESIGSKGEARFLRTRETLGMHPEEKKKGKNSRIFLHVK